MLYTKYRLHSLFAVLVALGCSATLSALAADAPSTELVQAAFDHQNAATVDCTFTVDLFNFPSGPFLAGGIRNEPAPGSATPEKRSVAPARYVRTPDILFRKGPKTELSSERTGPTGFLDARCKESSENGEVSGGICYHKTLAIWSGLDRIDHVLFPCYPRSDDLSTVFLIGWVKYGKVLAEQDAVNGHVCWKVDITDTGDSLVRHMEVWLDPSIGLCPRRLRGYGRNTSGAAFTLAVDWDEYSQVSPGIWFPGRQDVIRSAAEPSATDLRSLYKATKLDGTKTYTRDDLRVTFAPGTSILLTAEDGTLTRAVQP